MGTWDRKRKCKGRGAMLECSESQVRNNPSGLCGPKVSFDKWGIWNPCALAVSLAQMSPRAQLRIRVGTEDPGIREVLKLQEGLFSSDGLSEEGSLLPQLQSVFSTDFPYFICTYQATPLPLSLLKHPSGQLSPVHKVQRERITCPISQHIMPDMVLESRTVSA